MASHLLVLGIASLLCTVAALCAVVFAIRRRRIPLRACGVAVTALSGMIIADTIIAPLRSDNPAMVTAQATQPKAVVTRAPAATPAPAPTQAVVKTDTGALRNFSTSWAEVVRVSVAALKAHDAAGEYLQNENIPDASRELKNCQASASGIVSSSFHLRLDTENGSDRALLTAIKKVGDGLGSVCRSAQHYLATNSPSDFSDAKTHFANAVDGIFQAESLARSKYQRLGGDPDTLLSFRTALR